MPLIKRYPNRKLYDTEAKQYVTLEGIAQIIREGQDVQVLDHESGEDLTNLTLSQIIFEQEKKKSGFLPRSILTSLIRTGGDTLDYLRRTLQTGVEAVEEQGNSLEERLQRLVKSGRISISEADELRSEIDNIQTPAPSSDDAGLLELMDEQLVGVLHRLNIPSYSELQSLQSQLSELTSKLESVLADGDEASLDETPSQKVPSTSTEMSTETSTETSTE